MTPDKANPLTLLLLLAPLAASGNDIDRDSLPDPDALTPPPMAEPPAPDPTPGRAADTDEIQARLELARLLADREHYDEAIQEYRRVLEAEPERIKARVGLARTLFWAGQHEAAAAEIEAIDTEDLSLQERLFIADLHLSNDDYDAAIELYAAYLAEHPDDHEVRHKKALALAWSERHAAAIEQFEALVEARPRDRQLQRQFAKVLTWADKPDRAIEMLQRSLEE
ncbi:TPR-domain containing protein [Halorhodospira halochloris]|uniref:TPR-domain containing protein n=1 Tax=Halorhodospira halochloris TaxID=1052 RepID=A0A0X8X6K6_HALHR|nr:tetratricopeptide repeat protein [Halorhodospira halochloris]MBK1651028.1 hypothetical protein [Halorhodospira halochloris]MCG5547370.1 tetratricopeptide repeat protein [Halorhodospira halochloris]BAU56461.1 TPR-domain containing protein [Halorhodospira halochloris]